MSDPHATLAGRIAYLKALYKVDNKGLIPYLVKMGLLVDESDVAYLAEQTVEDAYGLPAGMLERILPFEKWVAINKENLREEYPDVNDRALNYVAMVNTMPEDEQAAMLELTEFVGENFTDDDQTMEEVFAQFCIANPTAAKCLIAFRDRPRSQ